MPTRTETSQPRAARLRARGAPGTQSIQRATLLVRLIASSGRDGVRIADLVRLSRLQRPTAHRILKCLIAEGMAVQDADSGRYFLGPLLFELGLAAAPRFNLRELCRGSLARLAERTGDTVFLSVRSGYDSVCIDRAEGSFPIKALTLEVGTRRPLGVGAGGIALLMPLAEETVEEIVAANAPRLARYKGLSAPLLMRLLKRSHELGYALNDHHVTDGAVSIGLPIVNPYGEPYASISVGAIAPRMRAERRPELAAMLREEVQRLARSLAEAAKP